MIRMHTYRITTWNQNDYERKPKRNKCILSFFISKPQNVFPRHKRKAKKKVFSTLHAEETSNKCMHRPKGSEMMHQQQYVHNRYQVCIYVSVDDVWYELHERDDIHIMTQRSTCHSPFECVFFHGNTNASAVNSTKSRLITIYSRCMRHRSRMSITPDTLPGSGGRLRKKDDIGP